MSTKFLTTTAVALALATGSAAMAGDKQGMATSDAEMRTGFELFNESAKLKGQFSAEALIGADVLNADGEDIGDIEDILIDPASKSGTQVLVEIDGSWLGADKHVVMPLKALKGHADGFMTAQTKAELEGLEGWREDGVRWLTVAEYEAEEAAEKAAREAAEAKREMKQETAEVTREAKEEMAELKREAKAEAAEAKREARNDLAELRSYDRSSDPGLKVAGGFSAEELIGTDIQNANGDVIGEIEDVIIGRNGEANQVMVGLGGFLGLGERHVLVPMSTLNQDGDVFVSAKTKAEIEKMDAYVVSGDGWILEADAKADVEAKTGK
ncbi:MAG: PRC-barrel domain-containing protein [Alphaproteobacteria bacterium]|nr:PRC-barrel domain-containing protein [Alphaproteobacteria bacterium]